MSAICGYRLNEIKILLSPLFGIKRTIRGKAADPLAKTTM
jgi:hypothetical protein